MGKKILIVIGDVGSGHRSAAIAITNQLKRTAPNIEVKTVDIFTCQLKRKLEKTTIELIARKFAQSHHNDDVYESVSKTRAFNFIYDISWHLLNTSWGNSFAENVMVNAYKHEFREVIEDYKPDVVISIHPAISMLVKHFKKDFNYKYFTIITDLVTLQKGWIDKTADITFAPSIEAISTLKAAGIRDQKIFGPTFPIEPKFEKVKDKDSQLEELGLSKSKTTLLIAGGGLGIYSALRHVNQLLRTDKYQIIIITGKAKTLQIKLERRFKNKKDIKVLGYVNNMQDIMNAADVVISKTGPGIIIELEVLNKKAVFTQYIGAQEKGNICYISGNPMFRYIGNRKDLINKKIEELMMQETTKKPKRNVKETEKIVKVIIDHM